MGWTTRITDPRELLETFPARPDAKYRPVGLWWWSGEPVTEDRMLWQIDRMHELGFGGFAVIGLAPHGPSAGAAGDDPPGFGPEWLRLFRIACERAKELGMGVVTWSPWLPAFGPDTRALLDAHPGFRGELPTPRGIEPFGFDLGDPEAMDALRGPGTINGAMLEATSDLLGDAVVGVFEDEFPAFPRWSPRFAQEFRAIKGYDPPPDAFDRDHGPRTPAIRWDVFDVMVMRAERAYTEPYRAWVETNRLLAGYDQNGRGGDPFLATLFYGDPFRTMAWANAPGTDQMGDARFYLSAAGMQDAPRVWLEGFHSFGWGLSLADQMELLFEWGREGVSLFAPHGVYYANKALWWEWASPEMGWKQPWARHYPAFADAVGRLMTITSAGRHVPEVAVLYPLSTVWACWSGFRGWDEPADVAVAVYHELMGRHGLPSTLRPDAWDQRSLLADAHYDRVVVDERHVDASDVPLIVPGCACLRTDTVERLVRDAEAGRIVVVVRPVPRWSADVGRDDPAFTKLVERLAEVATVVDTAADAVAALPPPRVDGLPSQWRRVGDLDVVLVTGSGRVRVRGAADRAPRSLDVRTGADGPLAADADGGDLVLELPGPAAVVALPRGARPPVVAPAYDEIELPEVWDCEYVPWGENRWGDYRLPPSDGTPPVERRTYAHREGDDDAWRAAPVVPEDAEHPTVELGFRDRMAQVRGRPAPCERMLPDGWREVVSTYGPKATLDGAPIEYSERLGVEDLHLASPFGLKGFVEPVKADLGEGGGGRIVSWAHVPAPCRTHLVVECAGIVTVTIDGDAVAGPVEGGALAVPVELEAGWHEVSIDVRPREVLPTFYSGYWSPPRTKVSWALMDPPAPVPSAVWGGPVVHPDYKGSQTERSFRRRVLLPERAKVRAWSSASGPHTFDVPDELPAGEHELTASVGGSLQPGNFACSVTFEMASATSTIVTDDRWECAGSDGAWEGVMPLRRLGIIGGTGGAAERRRSPFLDVAWLEGDDAIRGHAEDAWSDSPSAPPPAWFCFTAPPGAAAITLPIEGEVQAWLDGERAEIRDGRLPLRERARVALRVQAPPGRRGAACFTEHAVLELGPGTIRTGVSWHRQGLDCFSGVVLHRATVDVADGGPAILDLGEVRGSVEVRVNGRSFGVVAWAPWELPVELAAGTNTIELEVANTLGPLAGRGIPTPYGPEEQRTSGILGRPRLRIAR